MKKVLKITGIVVGAVLLVLIIFPVAFKGKIKDIAVSQANSMLNAGFTMDGLNVSLIRNFPNATVTVRGLKLWGIGDFTQDTLVSADRISATVNLGSIFGNSGFDIRRVEVAGTDIKAIVLEDGRPNWDVMKPSDEAPEVEKESGEPSDFRILLKKLTLSDMDIVYDDRQSKMYASLDDLSLSLSGDMTAERTVLKLKTEIEQAGFRYGGIPYLSDGNIAISSDVDADLKNMSFTLGQSRIKLNAITAGLEGTFGMFSTWM